MLEDARGIADRITALRRAIHAEPELGLQTPKTRDKVRAELADLPLEWREGPRLTGAVAILNGAAKRAARVLLRGDMDALPMPEETGLDFASAIPGAMHACGHDTHMRDAGRRRRLLAARARRLAGEVRFMFQPGEEGFHGARFMLEDGLLDPLPDAAFALHVMPNAPHGVSPAAPGRCWRRPTRSRSSSTGAAATPRCRTTRSIRCRSPARSSWRSRRWSRAAFDVADPAVVVTIAQIEAGTAAQRHPRPRDAQGTIRTLSPERAARCRAAAIARARRGHRRGARLRADVTITEGFPPTVCDPRAVELAEAVGDELFGAARSCACRRRSWAPRISPTC